MWWFMPRGKRKCMVFLDFRLTSDLRAILPIFYIIGYRDNCDLYTKDETSFIILLIQQT